VVAGCFLDDSEAKLKAQCKTKPELLHVVKLDVTSDESVQAAEAFTRKLVTKKGK
jgi:hypothetical protein